MAKFIKKYEANTQFCLERLMCINQALDAAGKAGKGSPCHKEMTKMADLWADDMVNGQFEVQDADSTASTSEVEDALEDGPKTIGGLAKAIKCSTKDVRVALKHLLKEGKVTMDGERRSKKYELSQAAKLAVQ